MSAADRWVVTVCGVIVVVFAVGLYWSERRRNRLVDDRHELSARAHGFEAALGRVGADIAKLCEDTRYEVMIADWAEDEGEHWVGNPMRFRWVVFDANRYLYALAVPNPLYGDPETQETVLDPLMLGNAATRAEAEVQAMAWVAKQDPEAAAVVS